ncbi:Cadherin-23 [Hypsibius exemplaris]|uniref:Cadherin-23 n=1 Tax=Hypsibius exemplaris TaxID=2072580 RepID=A0A9X6RML7_HYPEX|nr:Cadherin-23 [Hypsibius exemplaris]
MRGKTLAQLTEPQRIPASQWLLKWSLLTAAFLHSCAYAEPASNSATLNTIPRFDLKGNLDNFVISEDAKVGDIIYTLRGQDSDPNAVLTFGVSGEGADVVEIINSRDTPREAKVRLIRKLDRETQASHLIRLTLTDGIISKPIVQDSTLYVEDTNDETPQFVNYNTTYYVPEDAAPGTVIGLLSARDKDAGVFGMVRFDELDNRKTFRVETLNPNTGTGRIVLIGHLDYESQPMYQLRIIVMDGMDSLQRVNTATLAVVVQVLDVQDTPPQFIIYPSVQFVPENVAIGKEVFNVLAQDGDRGVPNKIEYALQPADGPFAIDRQSGIVYVAQALDREAGTLKATGGTIVMTVVATEVPNTPGSTASVQVTVIIEDVNDNSPKFYNGEEPTDSYTTSILENSAVGALVSMESGVIPRVYDPDQGINGTFALSIVGEASDIFDITPTSVVNEALFMIRVRNSSYLDFEVQKQFQFSVMAREIGTVELFSSTASFTVNVLDANDNVPVFNPDFYEVHMKENPSEGTHVLKVQAYDSDTGDFGVIFYTSLQGKYADLFKLDPITGDITVAKSSTALDREVIPEVYLSVEAKDNRGLGNRATAQIRIILDDVNDNAPVFDVDLYEATLLENHQSFLRPLIVHATDRDAPDTPNSNITYAIKPSQYSGHFAVNSNGEIFVTKPFDYEAIAALYNESSAVIQLDIAAFDAGEPRLSAFAAVKIFLQDENDNAPVFLQQQYAGIVSEAALPGTVVVTVAAMDADRSNLYGRVVYRIERGAQDKFAIDATTGVITLASGANLDRDVQESYELKVIALDGGFGSDQKTGSTTVTITVTDVNNKSPVFPTFPVVEVSEAAPIGSVIMQIEAHDSDLSARLTYTLIDVTDALSESQVPVRQEDFNYTACFGLRTDGTLYVAAPLDREVFETVKLTVQVQDVASEAGLQTAVATISVRILDVNDNPPFFIFPQMASGQFYENSVIENFVPTSPIFTIVASDKDKDRKITYSLDQVDPTLQTFFRINSDTGDIRLLQPLDHEQFAWINFTVQATDSGKPPLSSVVPVFLKVIDVNDNNPNFTIAPSEVTVSEAAAVGQEVTTVHAVDPDSDAYGMVSYTLDPATALGKFTIDQDSGRITVASPLDREQRDSFSLVVNAIDDYQNGFNRESRKSSVTIRIIIQDVNDNAPLINSDDLTGCIRLIETDAAGTQFYTIRATDADQPGTPNSEIRYRVVGGNGTGLFDVSSNFGIMTTKVALTNRYGNYSLNVEAKDSGFPVLSSNFTFRICVDDFNDNAPVFVQPFANESVWVWENATVGTPVVQIRATDSDIGDNARIKYTFATDQNFDFQTFKIDEDSGWIVLAKTLDRERQKQYSLFVDAHDMGIPRRNTVQRFTVKVKDINDNEPIFQVARQEFHVVENYKPNSVIGRVAEALDEDGDAEHTQTCYFITSGNNMGAFVLDKHTRELRLLSSLDRETVSVYNLTVQATSNCGLQSVPGLPMPLTTKDHTVMQAIVVVDDINDNAPKFTRHEYTAGVTVESKYGTRVTKLTATDPDTGENAIIHYSLIGEIHVNLNVPETFRDAPFTLDKNTGEVFLNVKFTPDMKGYFDFNVTAEDRDGLNDTAKVFIYLLRADQRVQFTLLGKPDEVHAVEEALRDVLSNITGARANIDDVVTHIDENGNVNERLSDVLMHFVDPSGKIMDVDTVINLIDQMYDRLESVFADYKIIEVQRAVAHEPATTETTILKAMLIGITMGLLLLLIVSIGLFCSQRSRYTRKLRAATAVAFSSSDSTAGLHPAEVPGTNIHSYEGSNPVWMNSYVEKWSKDTDAVSRTSNKSSIDENCVPPPNPYEEQVRKTTFFGEEVKRSSHNLVMSPGSGPILRKSNIHDLSDRPRRSDQQYNNIYETIEDKEGKYMTKLESTEL